MNNVFEFELCSLPLAVRTYLVLNHDCAGEPPALQIANSNLIVFSSFLCDAFGVMRNSVVNSGVCTMDLRNNQNISVLICVHLWTNFPRGRGEGICRTDEAGEGYSTVRTATPAAKSTPNHQLTAESARATSIESDPSAAP